MEFLRLFSSGFQCFTSNTTVCHGSTVQMVRAPVAQNGRRALAGKKVILQQVTSRPCALVLSRAWVGAGSRRQAAKYA